MVVTVAATGVVECLVHARGSYPRRNGGPVPYDDVPDGTQTRLVGLSAMRSGTNPQMMVAVARQSMDRSATFSRTIRRVRSARRSRVADGYDS